MKSGVILEAIEGKISNDRFETLKRFFDCLKEMIADAVNINEVKDIKQRLAEAWSYMERDFPIALLVRYFGNLYLGQLKTQ